MRPSPSRLPVIPLPPRRLVASVVLAVVCGLLVTRTLSSAQVTASRFGELVDVWIADDEIEVGRSVGGRASLQRWPRAFVPAGAVTEDPSSRTALAPVAAGEVLVASRLSGAGREGVASLVPDGWRAIAIPMTDAALPVRAGQRVELLGSFPSGDGLISPAVVLSADGLVVDVGDDDAITVAVPAARATKVAAALSTGLVTVTLVG